MVRPTTPVGSKLGSGRDGPFSSLFAGSNRPSLFVGILIGMSVMAVMMRFRETTDLNALNDLMTASTSNTAPTSGIRKTTRQKLDDSSLDVIQRIEAEQTGRVRVSAPKTSSTETNRPVRFVNHKQLSEYDAFSASWLQKRESFLSMKLDDIGICEGAAFFAYNHDRLRHLKMTMDWLDFSVEHLSKWYTIMNVMENDIPLQSALNKLDSYLQRGRDYPVEKEPFLKETISVIAFMATQENDESNPTKARNLSVRNLAATVESLRRAGMGRVVVVGMEESDEGLAEEAFQLIRSSINKDPTELPPGGIKRVGHMEVQFAQGHSGHSKTSVQEKNIPRAALMGLREAFRLQERGDNYRAAVVNIRTWLGDHEPNYWKYVYLTEPDSILVTRPSTLQTLRKYVEGGTVLIPWRLQPIPHESDVRGTARTDLYLKDEGDFSHIMELDGLDDNPDKCCDSYQGPDYKPGLPPNFEDCGNFWYMCDFSPSRENAPDAHQRLKPYQLIRLKHGTQFTHLASQEHGRPCVPVQSQNKDICEPPDDN